MPRLPTRLLCLCLIPLTLVTTGCFTGQTASYAYGDADVLGTRPTAPAYVVEAETGPVLVLRPRLGNFDFLFDARRWVVLPLGNDFAPPAELDAQAVLDGRKDIRQAIRDLGADEVQRLDAAATKLRQTARAVTDAGIVIEPYTRPDGTVLPLTDNASVVLYRVPTSDATSQPAVPAFAYAMIIPSSFETTGGDKTYRAVVGTVGLPVAVVGDAALIVGGTAAAAFAAPVFGVALLVRPLFR